jgi:hypothetical protein
VLGFKLVHRMIMTELLKVFLLAWAGLTSLLLLAGLVAEATQHGLGPAQILGAIPLLLPNMLPYTLPTTTLFATCIVYGRLAADNEILAMKSAGVHVGHAAWPALLLGLVAALTTAALYLHVIPSRTTCMAFFARRAACNIPRSITRSSSSKWTARSCGTHNSCAAIPKRSPTTSSPAPKRQSSASISTRS